MIGQKGYDFIFYNFCFAREDDTQFIDKIISVHKGGVPLIAMHCAMHTYHPYIKGKPEDKNWNKMLGVVSLGHGPHVPYDVTIAQDQKGPSCGSRFTSKVENAQGRTLHGSNGDGWNPGFSSWR